MKIAVTCENREVFQHFGHTPEFAIFEIEDGKICGMTVDATNGTGHGELAGFLAERKIDLLLCGGIGEGALQALAESGIEVTGGVQGNVIEAVGAYLMGRLEKDPNFKCSHQHHSHGETDEACHCHNH